MKRTSYQNAYGIETGDIVTTSYGTGPYEVLRISVYGHGVKLMYDWCITEKPVFSLSCGLPPEHAEAGQIQYWLSNIMAIDGRYLDVQGDEIFVHKPQRNAVQMSLFPDAPSVPYPFLPGTDYTVEEGKLWHCNQCGADFNGVKIDRPPICPHCKHPAWPAMVRMIWTKDVIEQASRCSL